MSTPLAWVRGAAIWLAALGLLGWVLPQLTGSSFFDPHLLLAYSALSILFSSPPMCEAVTGDAGQQGARSRLYRHAALAAGFGFLSSALLVAIRCWAVNRALRAPRLVLPPTAVLSSLLLVALAFAIFGTGAAAAVSVRSATASAAKRKMRTGFLLALLGVVLFTRYAPETWRVAFTGQFTTDALPRFAMVLAAMLGGSGMLLLGWAARDPRYSGLFPKS